SLINAGRVYILFGHVPFSDSMLGQLSETVSVDLRPGMLLQEHASDGRRTGGLIAFVHVHLINKELNVPIKLEGVGFMFNRHISPVPSALPGVVLIASHRKSRNMESFSSKPADVRGFKLSRQHRLPEHLVEFAPVLLRIVDAVSHL